MTNKESLDLARWTVAQARKQGATEAAATVSSSRSINVEVRDGKVDTLQESVRNGLSLAAYVDHRYSTQNTSDLRRDALSAFIAEAVAMTRHLARDEFRALPDPKYYRGQEKHDLNAVDPSFDRMDTAERIRRARAAEAAALAAGKSVISVEAGYSDSSSQTTRVNSNGFEGQSSGTGFQVYAGATVGDGKGGRVQDAGQASARHLKDLPDAAAVGREGTERAIQRTGQRKIASGRYDLLVENRVGARLLNPLIGAVNGRALQQKASFLDGMLGKEIASARLTIREDPFLPAGFGSRLFDGEGMAAHRRAVIEKGVLKTWYIDSYYGRKLGMEPTTGGPANLVFEPGDQDLAALTKSISKGILVTNFIGGNSNATTGDFSVGIVGFYVENGAIAHPVNEMNVSGNLKELWNRLAAVGSDPYPYSNWQTPSLRFTDVQFSGL